jgi:hypothetical protein
LSLIDRFSAATTHEHGRVDDVTEEASDDINPIIDRNFQEQVWALLTQHPDVFVRRDRTFNSLPLSDIEATSAVDRERVRVYAQTSGSTELTDDQAEAHVAQETPAVFEDAVLGDGIAPRTSGKALHDVVAKNSDRDEFGFPRRKQPTLQYRNGQASLEDGLKAANPSDFKPSAGDLVAVEKGNGEYVVELFNPHAPQENDDYCGACGGPGELLCCDGCPNAFHGACLEPPIDTNNLPDDQWYCPRCETNGAPHATNQGSLRRYSTISAANGSSTPKAAATPRRTPAKGKVKTKPLGRPRKFLPGTEQFWRAQFSKVPGLFASRPPNFDATLLQALNNGLPTPSDPADITQSWIDRTRAVLNRSAHGLYVSPKGSMQRASGNRKATSQVIVLRSARLREVDFSDGHEVSAVRFLSSSASHTFASLRYYPQEKSSGWPSKSRLANSPKTRRATTPQTPERRKGPKLGIFYDDTYLHQNLQLRSFVPAAAPLRRLSGQSVSTIGSPIGFDDVESQTLTTSPQPTSPQPVSVRSPGTISSQGHPPLEISNNPLAPRLENGLPPPLITRAASKRRASKQDEFAGSGVGASQNIATSTTPTAKSGAHGKSLLEQGQSRKRRLSDVDGGRARPKERRKKNSTGPSPAPTRRQIILDIIESCGGAIPDNSLLLWKAVTVAWHKSGEAGVPDKRTVDANLKALCTAGKIKKSTFSFKDQRGFMVISSILAKPGVGPVDPVMRQLQENIVNVYPNHYSPSGMYADQAGKAEGNLKLHSGVQPQRRKENSERRGERTQPSSALQPIENEASAPGKNVERVLGTKEIARIDPLAGTGRPQEGFVLGDASGPRSSSGMLLTDLGGEVGFLIRQERPIIFDVIVPSRISDSTAKTAEEESKKVIWRKGPRTRPMPRSLEEVLHDATNREEADPRLTKSDLDLSRFESEVDSVARWEERSFNRFQEKNESQNWNFISHFVGQNFETARIENTPVQFNGLTWYDRSGREKLIAPAALKQLWATVSHTQNSPAGTAIFPMMVQQLDTSGAGRSQTIGASDASPRASNSRSIPSKKRKRKPAKSKPSKKKQAKLKPRKNRKMDVEPAYITNPDGTVVDVSGYINAPVKRARGTQHLRNMSEAAIYKLTVAIVVVKTLSGGLDKHIDWTIVLRIFPDENLDFIHDRWKTIRNKFRRDIAALTENLQDRFCSAYIEGEVPDLDFDDIYNNDWEGIVEWAVRSLDKSCVKGIEDLPYTREELADTKTMAFEEHRGMREYLGYNVGSSLPVREAAQASTVFAKPVESLALQPPEFSSDVLEKEEQLNVAKSWALATVLTPEGNYDAFACKRKLSKLAKTSRASDALFDQALKSLISEKTVFRDDEAATLVVGRGFKASKLFYDAIDARRTVQAKVLRQAARYKRDVLDPVFSAGQQLSFQPTSVEDGDMVAILNLLASGRVRVQIGPDVPKNRYGLLTADGTGTYQTRHLEKDKLSFTVLVEAVEGEYVYGNPLEMQIAPVPAIADYDTIAIPVWVDIHGNFQDELWELMICAVVGLISTRPGINAAELVKTLSPSLTLWETEIVLQWMERSGFVEASSGRNGRGWDTTEWWWLVCGGLSGWHVGNLS